MKLIEGMGKDPNIVNCVDVLQAALKDLGDINEIECDCYLKVSPQKFYDWTSVHLSSCGPGNGLSFKAERGICNERRKNGKLKNTYGTKVLYLVQNSINY